MPVAGAGRKEGSMKKKKQYVKPVIEKETSMNFMFEVIKKEFKKSCRQCSSCHGCR